MEPDATRLLAGACGGDAKAAADLLGVLYDDLRARAAGYLAHERVGHTLSPTALVHEAYVRLIDRTHAGFKNRAHFAGAAAVAMRRILVDHARARGAAKRGGAGKRVAIDTSFGLADKAAPAPVDVLALDEVLTRLAALHERQAKVVEMRFFGGLTAEEAAEALGVSLATVESDWRMARTWLHRELSK